MHRNNNKQNLNYLLKLPSEREEIKLVLEDVRLIDEQDVTALASALKHLQRIYKNNQNKPIKLL